jgi:hypothetical protein
MTLPRIYRYNLKIYLGGLNKTMERPVCRATWRYSNVIPTEYEEGVRTIALSLISLAASHHYHHGCCCCYYYYYYYCYYFYLGFEFLQRWL